VAGPIAIDEAARRGATLCGCPLVRLIAVTDDGREISVPLPMGADLTPGQERIVSLLAESPCPLTRKQIATKLNRGNVTGRFGQHINALIDERKIFERDGEVTDDATKFASTA
jgi:hypothetical protein